MTTVIIITWPSNRKNAGGFKPQVSSFNRKMESKTSLPNREMRRWVKKWRLSPRGPQKVGLIIPNVSQNPFKFEQQFDLNWVKLRPTNWTYFNFWKEMTSF